MQRIKFRINVIDWSGLFKRTAPALVLAGWLIGPLAAQQSGQRTFSSAEAASEALVTAAQNNDEKALLNILGPDATAIVSSGDPEEDAQDRANFVKRYREMHRLVQEPDKTTTLYIGPENWPMPIPLLHQGGAWYFDTATAKKEILYRRIGRNEISTIHVLQQLVAAEKEYYSSHNHEYAEKIFSAEGKQDGLYWKASEAQPQSPIGPLVASAVAEGYAPGRDSAPPVPYRGYYYHVLTGQGSSASGGAKSYVVDGKMTAGFAFIAYPAEYRSSGVMTFVVGPDGVVYRKDLGEKTSSLARAVKVFNPDSTWKKDENQQDQTASDHP